MTIKPRKIARYGWHRGLPRLGDPVRYKAGTLVGSLPPAVDLRPQIPFIPYDQGGIGSCTANALAGAIEFDILRQGLPDMMPSRLFIYYNEREVEGSVTQDAGASLSDGVATLASEGVCPETDWPYNTEMMFTKPDVHSYSDAMKNIAINYQRLSEVVDVNYMKQCLYDGFPFVFGFVVYESFESSVVANTGIVPMPNPPTDQVIGGHAVLCVGYRDDTQMFICRNSWGTTWGDKGYFYIPYSYLTNVDLADDFWTIQAVKSGI